MTAPEWLGRPVRNDPKVVVGYRADLYRAAKGDAEAKREALITAVREANARGISEYDLAIQAGVTRMTIRAWLGK